MTGRVMTEAEAAEVWCPWAIGLVNTRDENREIGQTATHKTVNRVSSGNGAQGCHCLASKCAAWVWVDPDKHAPLLRHRQKGGLSRGPARRPAGVPLSWKHEDDEGHWWWYEDDDAFERRSAEVAAGYPAGRRGACGNVKGGEPS